eukprot:m.19899 g.19899  ORF g.19899 m.19899 type:complete len:292 (+) comp27926_c0_seq1:196-1071(+)
MEQEPKKRRLAAPGKITSLTVQDIRFPTSLDAHGSDAMHKDPDYSAAYVVIASDGTSHKGHGLTFTVGRGTEVVVLAVQTLSRLVVGKQLEDIYADFATFWRELTSETQLRWIGPEKGVIHLATAAVVNALWDLWAKIEEKPLWKLLANMTPEEIVSTIDFRYITDALTRQEALEILRRSEPYKGERETVLKNKGYPAYTTSCAWLGYSDETLSDLAQAALRDGFTRFKVKVGADLADDQRRCSIIRKEVGWDKIIVRVHGDEKGDDRLVFRVARWWMPIRDGTLMRPFST